MVHKLVYLINIEKKEKATAFLIHTIDLTSRWQHESSVGSISGSSSLQATATGAPIPSNRRSLIAASAIQFSQTCFVVRRASASDV